jgi:hypothetical protein
MLRFVTRRVRVKLAQSKVTTLRRHFQALAHAMLIAAALCAIEPPGPAQVGKREYEHRYRSSADDISEHFE